MLKKNSFIYFYDEHQYEITPFELRRKKRTNPGKWRWSSLTNRCVEVNAVTDANTTIAKIVRRMKFAFGCSCFWWRSDCVARS